MKVLAARIVERYIERGYSYRTEEKNSIHTLPAEDTLDEIALLVIAVELAEEIAAEGRLANDSFLVSSDRLLG